MGGKTHITRKMGGESGSPRYMAPEIYDDTAKITEKVDIWAVGCILIEIFGGPLPYHDCQNIQQICSKMIQKIHPVLPVDVSPEMIAVIHPCLVFDPKMRTTA